MVEKACFISGKKDFKYDLIYKVDEKLHNFFKNLIEMCDIKVFFFTANDDFTWYCFDTLSDLKEDYPEIATYYLDLPYSDCCDNSLITTWLIDKKFTGYHLAHDPSFKEGKNFPKCPEVQLDFMSKKILDEILLRNTSIICYGDIYDTKTVTSFRKFTVKYKVDTFTLRKYNLTCFKAYDPEPRY